MAVISPFKGLRYNLGKVKDLSLVTTPPYDVISPSAQQEYYDIHENNIIRIELGKDFDGDNDSNNKYTRAGSSLNEWISNGTLNYEEKPALYIYEQDFSVSEWEIKTRRGLICLVKLAEFSEGIVLPHESTLSNAKIDRFSLMNATNANISQIFSLYNGNGKVFRMLEYYVESKSPDIEYTNKEDINERVWIITDPAIISDIQSCFTNQQLFIADGHHRYETALNYRKKLATESSSHSGEESYNYVMMTLVDMDDPGLVVLPTHRALKDLQGYDSQEFLKFAEEYFHIDKIEFNKSYHSLYIPEQIRVSLEQSGEFNKSFGYYDNSEGWYYILALKDMSCLEKALSDKSPACRNLDVSILHLLILEKYFKIDARNMASQTNLSYTRDIKQALEWVNSNTNQCAFFLNPTQVNQIKEVSLANEKMPQKSTYFYPKLTTGLVIYKF
jgi:uncharacterized protein (DUF1015 family)